MAEAAERWKVDRGVIMRIRTVAKEGALEALSNSTSRGQGQGPRLRARGGPGRRRPSGRGPQGDGGEADAGRGKRTLGLSGQVPRPRRRGHQGRRCSTLLDCATDAGWSFRRCLWRARARRGPGLSLDGPPRTAGELGRPGPRR